MGWLYQLFFPAHTPTENELEMGRYRIIAEGAVAGVIYAVAAYIGAVATLVRSFSGTFTV